MDNNNYRVRRLEKGDAEAILRWRYDSPYDFYNPPENIDANYYVRQFLDPELMFHAIVDSTDNFIGFCSYGADGQVSGGNYIEQALDVGLGMKPELTGQGRGVIFFRTILEYGEALSSGSLRLSVATFNCRAISLYNQFGFEEVEQFIDDLHNVPYTIMTREN